VEHHGLPARLGRRGRPGRSLLAAAGSRGAYLLALGLFLAGTLVCAVAPTMAVLLVGGRCRVPAAACWPGSATR